jgi:hypothetical protein
MYAKKRATEREWNVGVFTGRWERPEVDLRWSVRGWPGQGRQSRKVLWRFSVLGGRRNQFGSTARCKPSSPGGALLLPKRRLKRSVLSWSSCSDRSASSADDCGATSRSDQGETPCPPGIPCISDPPLNAVGRSWRLRQRAVAAPYGNNRGKPGLGEGLAWCLPMADNVPWPEPVHMRTALERREGAE